MNHTKIKPRIASSQKTLLAIWEEIRLLRNELMLFLPNESIRDYAHPTRIKRSYLKALEEHPPVSV